MKAYPYFSLKIFFKLRITFASSLGSRLSLSSASAYDHELMENIQTYAMSKFCSSTIIFAPSKIHTYYQLDTQKYYQSALTNHHLKAAISHAFHVERHFVHLIRLTRLHRRIFHDFSVYLITMLF